MWEHVKALEDRNPVDQLACLILRVLHELAPCTERSLIEQVSGGDRRSQPDQASHAHMRELVHSALLKLKALACIEVAGERIAITDQGRRCLKELPLVTLRQRSAEASDKAHRRVATDDGKQDAVNGITKAEMTHPWVPSHCRLPARLGMRRSALLRVLATILRPEYALRLERFCRDRLTQVSLAMPPGGKMTVVRAWDTSLYLWRHRVAPVIRSGVTNLVHVLVQLAKVFSRAWQPMRLSEETGHAKIGARLLKARAASGLLRLNLKLGSFVVSPSINYAGALLLVCGALSIAGGVVFLSSEGANSSSAEEAFLSGKGAGSSRGSPIVWLHDGQEPLGRSIFVTRKLAGAAWIEGFAIRGENASNQTLTGLQAAIKTASGEEIKLAVDAEGSQGKRVDAQDVAPGSKFLLKSAVSPGGTQAGMPAEEFLSKYGGM